mgnify:CR=1 FL=1
MNFSAPELFNKLAQAVVEMDEGAAVQWAQAVLAAQYDAYQAIEKGLAQGMEEAGRLFEEEIYFIPELLMCSDAMYAGLEVLVPHIKGEVQGEKYKVVIGVIQGDTHDIGKNLVKTMLETTGFEVFDLGRDVAPEEFVAKAQEWGADIIAISTLMTTTRDGMAQVIKILEEQKLRDKFKVMVGGGPISKSFAEKIGADGYAVNAGEAVKVARELMEDGIS